MILFDCDGVLTDSEFIELRLLAEMLTEVGYDISYEDVRKKYMGMKTEEIMETVSSEKGIAFPRHWTTEYQNRKEILFRKRLRPIRGVETAIIEILEENMKICVVSQSTMDHLVFSLEITGLIKYFEKNFLFSSYMVERGKPFPDIYLYAAKKMGYSTDECAVVEDSVIGVKGGIAANMHVFAYIQDEGSEILQHPKVCLFDDMNSLPSLLGIQ